MRSVALWKIWVLRLLHLKTWLRHHFALPEDQNKMISSFPVPEIQCTFSWLLAISWMQSSGDRTVTQAISFGPTCRFHGGKSMATWKTAILGCSHGGFHKWGYPKMDGPWGKIPWKWMIWGYPYFRKPPYLHSKLGRSWSISFHFHGWHLASRAKLSPPRHAWLCGGSDPLVGKSTTWNIWWSQFQMLVSFDVTECPPTATHDEWVIRRLAVQASHRTAATELNPSWCHMLWFLILWLLLFPFQTLNPDRFQQA